MTNKIPAPGQAGTLQESGGLREVSSADENATSHNWVKSTLGHGETMCTKCWCTNREAAVLGMLDRCTP